MDNKHKKLVKFFLTFLFCILLFVWLIYYIGNNIWGINTSITAGDLLVYIGTAFTILLSFYGIKLTIDKGTKDVAKQIENQNNLFIREIKKEYDIKMYDDIVSIVKNVLWTIKCFDLHSSLESLALQQDDIDVKKRYYMANELITKEKVKVLYIIEQLWFYYEQLLRDEIIYDKDDENVNLLDINDLNKFHDSLNIIEYFKYINNSCTIKISKILTPFVTNNDELNLCNDIRRIKQELVEASTNMHGEIQEKTHIFLTSLKKRLEKRYILNED